MSQQQVGSAAMTKGWRVQPDLMGSALMVVIRDNFLGLKEPDSIRLVNLADRTPLLVPFDIDVAFFTFDIAQRLLVLVEPLNENGYSTGANVHLRHLPTDEFDAGAPHNNLGPLLCQFPHRSTECSSRIFGEAHIAGDLVGITVSSKDLYEDGETVVSVWNWKTGTQLAHLSNKLFTNFIFMNKRRILVSHRAFHQMNPTRTEDGYTYGPAMLVYDLGTQKLSSTWEYRCAFLLGPYTNRPDKATCYLRSDPSALRECSDSQQPEFLICSCEYPLVIDESLCQSEESRTPDSSLGIEDQTSPPEKYGIGRASGIKKYIFATDLESKIEGADAVHRSEDWLQLSPKVEWDFGFISISGTRILEISNEPFQDPNNKIQPKSYRIAAKISDFSPGNSGVEGNGRNLRRSKLISYTNIPMDSGCHYAGFITNDTVVIMKMLKVPELHIKTTYVFKHQLHQPEVSDESRPRADHVYTQLVKFQ